MEHTIQTREQVARELCYDFARLTSDQARMIDWILAARSQKKLDKLTTMSVGL